MERRDSREAANKENTWKSRVSRTVNLIFNRKGNDVRLVLSKQSIEDTLHAGVGHIVAHLLRHHQSSEKVL